MGAPVHQRSSQRHSQRIEKSIRHDLNSDIIIRTSLNSFSCRGHDMIFAREEKCGVKGWLWLRLSKGVQARSIYSSRSALPSPSAGIVPFLLDRQLCDYVFPELSISKLCVSFRTILRQLRSWSLFASFNDQGDGRYCGYEASRAYPPNQLLTPYRQQCFGAVIGRNVLKLAFDLHSKEGGAPCDG